MVKRKCPKCGSNEVIPIQYGLPVYDPNDKGGYEQGGCCIDDDSPDFRCAKCGLGFQKEKSEPRAKKK